MRTARSSSATLWAPRPRQSLGRGGPGRSPAHNNDVVFHGHSPVRPRWVVDDMDVFPLHHPQRHDGGGEVEKALRTRIRPSQGRGVVGHKCGARSARTGPGPSPTNPGRRWPVASAQTGPSRALARVRAPRRPAQIMLPIAATANCREEPHDDDRGKQRISVRIIRSAPMPKSQAARLRQTRCSPRRPRS